MCRAFCGTRRSRVSPVRSVCVPVAKHLACKFDLTVESRSCTKTASAKDWKIVSLRSGKKNCCLILLFVANNRCNRFDILVNCLLRVGGDFKNILVHTKCTFSHAVCVNVWNLSRCPGLVLFFLLQQSHVALQKVVVVTGVASFFSLFLPA